LLAHNVGSADEVDAVIAKLTAAEGTLLRPGDAPPHGGYRGYVADPDGHAWEIAWNPAWPIDADGHVRFGV
jgi:predicted lactoylglutathione lyase